MIAVGAGAQQRRRASSPPTSTDTSLAFYFDSGFRALNATNPAPGIDPASGTFYLYYTDHLTGRQMVMTSSDGLTFANAAEPRGDWRFDPRNTLMPDGKTWRRYEWDLVNKLMKSSSSTDGIHFTADTGTRYTPQANDANSIGVYDAFSDRSGGVVLLYIGDLTGANNIRRAYSRDNGLAFTFDRGDVLGDAGAGGGANSYVDEKTIRLPDGRIRLFTMKQHVIDSFISNDDGYSFTREAGARLERSAYGGATLTSLNDPVVVHLADGRDRMYVASLRSDNVWVIVSATTK